jgi:hypothetical protein
MANPVRSFIGHNAIAIAAVGLSLVCLGGELRPARPTETRYELSLNAPNLVGPNKQDDGDAAPAQGANNNQYDPDDRAYHNGDDDHFNDKDHSGDGDGDDNDDDAFPDNASDSGTPVPI